MKSKQKGSTMIQLMIVGIWLAVVGGWIANIVKLIGMTIDPLTLEVILRAVGIFVFPLGAVMGFL